MKACPLCAAPPLDPDLVDDLIARDAQGWLQRLRRGVRCWWLETTRRVREHFDPEHRAARRAVRQTFAEMRARGYRPLPLRKGTTIESEAAELDALNAAALTCPVVQCPICGRTLPFPTAHNEEGCDGAASAQAVEASTGGQGV